MFEVKNLLNKMLKLFNSNSEIVDHIYIEQSIHMDDKKNKIVKIK